MLVGAVRVLQTNTDGSNHGVFTDRAGSLTNDFFVNLLDLGTEWKATDDTENAFERHDRVTGAVKWTGTRCDLIFGSNSQLRAIAEVYRAKDADDKFVNDFVKTLKQGHEPRPVQPVLGPPGANRGAGPICGSFQAPFCMRNA